MKLRDKVKNLLLVTESLVGTCHNEKEEARVDGQIRAYRQILNMIDEEQDNWISVEDRMPEEHESMFTKLKGTDKWVKGMFERISDDVNCVVEYEIGNRFVKTLHTIDGKFVIKGIKEGKVTHWKPLPELPEREE